MSSYHSLLEPLFPGVNPAGIEAYIRLEEPVIDDLAMDQFLHYAEKAVSYESAFPGFLEDLIGRGAPPPLSPRNVSTQFV